MTTDATSRASTHTGNWLKHDLYADPVTRGLPDTFPFRSVFSLDLVVEHWRKLGTDKPESYGAQWEEIERRLAEAPDLEGQIEDHEILDRHWDLVELLLRPLCAGTDWSTEARAVADPFGEYTPYRSKRFDAFLGGGGVRNLDTRLQRPTLWMRSMYAYRAILHQYYGFSFSLDRPLVFAAPVEGSTVIRYLKLNSTSNFLKVNLKGELPELGPEDFEVLMQNTSDFGVWSTRLPPDLFEIEGVAVVTLTDVTNETATASIKHIILTSDADITEEIFDIIEREVKNLYRDDSVRLGLASLQADGEMNFRSDRRIWNSLVIRDALVDGSLEWRGSVYEQSLSSRSPISVPSVEQSRLGRDLKAELRSLNVLSLFLQPLEYDGRIVGVLELSSPLEDALGGLSGLKIENVKSIFALAVHQNLERFENRVDSVIQETYTSIHNSVGWKFRDAAIRMLEREKETGLLEPEEIRFTDLYPLYGSADIRGSSDQRNEAIRTDILQHLQHASDAIAAMTAQSTLTILDELRHRIGRHISRLESGWTAGDEAVTQQFIRESVEPTLVSVAEHTPELFAIVEAYRSKTDVGGLVSTGRRAFEESQARINGLIVDMLTAEQEIAQTSFPHYFEHTKTDGVEHTIYVGQSIAPGRPFDLAFLQDLRLRQLLIACKVAREVQAVNQSIDLPLEVAQLILVQDTPITLQFRTDEKKFDVEGASGVRFETLKKRLEKAQVAGSAERVTQPEKVAIVYSLEREELEYRRYVEYLEANGYIHDEIETFDVADLQSISGLKALRFTVLMG